MAIIDEVILLPYIQRYDMSLENFDKQFLDEPV